MSKTLAIHGAALLLALVTPCPLATAQHVNESVPRPGESRANRHQYFSSHNSYQKPESITGQLDELNVWEIELDVRWANFSNCDGPAGFWVLHGCADLVGQGLLAFYLDEIASTNRFQTGFFFLNFDLGDGYVCLGCPGWPTPTFPTDYISQLQDLVVSKFGVDAIYSWQDFEADGMAWPSPQELVRRGKHVAIYGNTDDLDGQSIFFRMAGVWNSDTPTAFWNTNDENADFSLGNRYLIRRWPNPYCPIEDNDAWWDAYNNGISFPSTNCLLWHADNYPHYYHPPLPTYVTTSGSGPQRGTYDAPHRAGAGLVEACERSHFYSDRGLDAPSTAPLRVDAGTYDVTGAGGLLEGPVIIQPVGGVVWLE